jgi:ribosomal protein S18 acetylase RimI-like enzyme
VQIHHWTIDRAGELAGCYNRQIEDVPYCYSQSPETFSRGVEEDLGELYGFKRREAMTDEKLIVAEEKGSPVGFADVGVHETSQAESTQRAGVIRFLAYEPGQRAVGQALLEASEGEFSQLGLTKVAAFTKGLIYHFCSPDGGLSSLSAHVGGLLGLQGYQVGSRTVNMARESVEGEEPFCPDADVRLSVGGENRRSRFAAVMVDAQLDKDGEQVDVGECLGYPWDYVQSNDDAHDQIYINWLGIRRDLQGQGWGRYLLWKTLEQAQAAGYRQCVLGTDERNSRALLFYANYGFRVTHISHSYEKSLDAGS